jgi:hypothetical protein
MHRCPCHFLFLCLLTLIASADDFNLLRVVFPSICTSSPAGSLPLDDPNTDFVTGTSTRFPGPGGHALQFACAAPSPTSPVTAAPWLPTVAVGRCGPALACPCLTPPLRC